MNAGVTKRFHCQRCERRFARREHLQRHERSHTKEKPFGCIICAQTFTRRDLLVRHSRLTHGSSDSSKTGVTIPSPSLSPSSTLTEDQQAATLLNVKVDFQKTPRVPEIPAKPLKTKPQSGPSMSPCIQENPQPLDHEVQVTSSWPETSIMIDPTLASVPSVPSSSTWVQSSDFDTDFSSFLDTIAIPTRDYLDYFHFDQPLPYFSPDPVPDTPSTALRLQDHDGLIGATVVGDQDSLAQFGSRLPSLQPEDHRPSKPASPRLSQALTNVSIESRMSVVEKLKAFSNVVPSSFTLVSRHALSRYMTGFIAGFHDHLPFLHIPTTSLSTSAAELTLALAAIGAHYCKETDKAQELFKVAKAVCLERIRRQDEKTSEGDSTWEQANSFPGHPEESYQYDDDYKEIETAQALLVLLAMATWFERRPPAREAPAIRSLLGSLIRQEGMKSTPIPNDASWEQWIEYEGTKRTKFIIFCFFNLHSIVFDIPPMIMTGKIELELPSMEPEWRAQDSETWLEARKNRRPEPNFLTAFSGLFKAPDRETAATRPKFSSLGSYILIHGIIQHIYLTQELYKVRGPTWHQDQELTTRGHLHPNDISAIETALKSWQQSWERNPESSITPLSPHGPLSYNSTALLRLAYIRITINTGAIRSLGSCIPIEIARSIFLSPPIQRSKRMTRAALHCAHALSIPIKLGINSIAHTRLRWSIQHALCSLECALLLTKWLECVTVEHPNPPLNEAESKLLSFVLEMVAETEHAAPPEELLKNNKRLSAIVVRVWARLFRADDIWEMVTVIGKSLEMYADMLDSS